MPYVKQANGSYRWVEPPGSGLPQIPQGGIRAISGQQRLQAAGIDPRTAWEGDPGFSRQQNAALSAAGRSDERRRYEQNGGQYGGAPQGMNRQTGRMNQSGVQSAVQPGQTALNQQGLPTMQANFNGGQALTQSGADPFSKHGMTKEQLEAARAAFPSGGTSRGLTDLQVMSAFQDLLGRNAGQEGLDYWTSEQHSNWTPEMLRQSIMQSEEYQQAQQQAQQPAQQQQPAQAPGGFTTPPLTQAPPNAGPSGGQVAPNSPPGFGAPSSGLAGAEQAYQAALAGGLNLVDQGNTQARQDLQAGYQNALSGGLNLLEQGANRGRQDLMEGAAQGLMGSQAQLQQATNQGRADIMGGATQGLQGAMSLLQQGNDQARADLNQGAQQGLTEGIGFLREGTQQGRQDLTGSTQAANQALQPFAAPGAQGNAYQAALSGSMGPQAQAQAFQGYMSSPGFNYLLDQSERAIRRNAAATGGLGGSNVQRELQENAIGLAAQDFDNAFRRMSSISDRGLQAAGQVSGNMMQAGGRLADLTNQNAQLAGNMALGTRVNTANRLADTTSRNAQLGAGMTLDTGVGTGRSLADLTNRNAQLGASQTFSAGMDTGRNLASLSNQNAQLGAGMISDNAMATGNALAGISNQNAGNAAGMIYGTGNQIGAGRARAGEMIANNAAQSSGNLANLMYGTGRDMSNVIGGGGNFLSNLQLATGAGAAEIMQAYANALAGNTQTGAANFAGIQGLPNARQTTGFGAGLGDTVQGIGDGLGGIGDAIGAIGGFFPSDRRLKTNIEKIGTVGAHNLYRWDWTDEARSIVGDQPPVGVMADEVPPEFVHTGDDGFQRVDYGGLLGA